MSASMSAARGGSSARSMGTALVAIAMAIVVVGALLAIQVASSRSTTTERAPILTTGAFDRGYAAKQHGLHATQHRPFISKPAAAPAPGAVSTPMHDRGWASDGGAMFTPTFTVAGDHGAATEGGSIAAPAEDTVGGGRGTRFAR